MGCIGDASNCDDAELPVHRVMLNDYYIGKYEVTVAEFKAFIDHTGYQTEAEKNGGSQILINGKWKKQSGVSWRDDVSGNKRSSREFNHPVAHLNWNDAQAYVKWLSGQTGKTFRLPTEAEWEYAARGGVTSLTRPPTTYAGSNLINEVAWYQQSANSIGTQAVGSKKANALGLYDMSGNVGEWCNDWYSPNYYRNTPAKNPKGPLVGLLRVVRGGDCLRGKAFAQVDNRGGSSPAYSSGSIGIRIVREP